jgi:hypothetical protein
VGELEPVDPSKPETGGAWDHPAQIIDGGYFENEGMLTALELADWLTREGARYADRREVHPILIQVTSAGEVEAATADSEIVRCHAPFVDNPSSTQGGERPWQFIAPIIGLLSVREGHSEEELLDARTRYCTTAVGQAFFHFYLYKLQDGESVPLNWALSEATTAAIWDKEVSEGQNPDEWKALVEILKSGNKVRGNASGTPLSTSND